jgi:hypothetical protein
MQPGQSALMRMPFAAELVLRERLRTAASTLQLKGFSDRFLLSECRISRRGQGFAYLRENWPKPGALIGAEPALPPHALHRRCLT